VKTSKRHTVAILLLAFLLTGHARAQNKNEEGPALPDTTWRKPLSARNQFPFALLFVALAPERARSLAPGRSEIELQLDYSNIISREETDDSFFELDLEYLRTNLQWKRGFSHGLEVGVSAPLFLYYGGFLDPLVDAFHRALNLPNFQRGMTPHGLSSFELTRGGDTVLKGGSSFGGVGDLTVHFKKTLIEKNRTAFAVRTNVKLPTGDLDDLTGSGASDVGVGLAYDRFGDRFGVFFNASYNFLGKPDQLSPKNFVYVMGGFDIRLKRRLAMIIQIDYQSQFLEDRLAVLTRSAREIALGLRWRYSDRFLYEWRFVEDLSDVSPDFTIAFQMTVGWDSGVSS
jgi:hypothetical protein